MLVLPNIMLHMLQEKKENKYLIFFNELIIDSLLINY